MTAKFLFLKKIETLCFKTEALPPWFCVLLRKALEKVLDESHLLVILAISFLSKCTEIRK